DPEFFLACAAVNQDGRSPASFGAVFLSRPRNKELSAFRAGSFGCESLFACSRTEIQNLIASSHEFLAALFAGICFVDGLDAARLRTESSRIHPGFNSELISALSTFNNPGRQWRAAATSVREFPLMSCITVLRAENTNSSSVLRRRQRELLSAFL